MKNPVIIKGNKYGIKLVLDDSIDFNELKSHIILKFKESSEFFKNANMVLEIEGRAISSVEEKEILDIISENSDINIICIMNNDKESEEKYRYILDNISVQKEEKEDLAIDIVPEDYNSGEVYKGTLRSGQIIESNDSIIILGDVNPGAKVVSGSNVIVLGSLKGIVYAGMNGNTSSFVVALEMRPIQIKICDIIARSADNNIEKNVTPEIKIAFIEDENIYIEPLTKDVLNDIKI